jgi:hypothetical protein
VRSTTAPYTESRLTRSVANERVGFPVVEHNEITQISKSEPKKFSILCTFNRRMHGELGCQGERGECQT